MSELVIGQIVSADGGTPKFPNGVDRVGQYVYASGTATFTNVDNKISLPGIGIGVEAGDVISPFGSVSNNKEFTIESIVNDDNIIVNAAHAGGTSSKSLVNETVAVTVTLVCKHYLAPLGLGQGWLSVTASRAVATDYTSPANRGIAVAVTLNDVTQALMLFGGEAMWEDRDSAVGVNAVLSGSITKDTVYRVTTSVAGTLIRWSELR